MSEGFIIYEGFLKYITTLFPIKGCRINSKILVKNGFFIKSQTRNWWYFFTKKDFSLFFQKRHCSHQYGEWRPWAQWNERYLNPSTVANFLNWLCLNILTCPPGISWYSLLNPQQINSGKNLGTLKPKTPPGFKTLISSFIESLGESTCSKTSLHITESYDSSLKGKVFMSPTPNWQISFLFEISKSFNRPLATFRSS